MKKVILPLIILTFTLGVKAQQLNTFSQVSENKYLINPAVVGSDDSNPLFLGHKQLWSGIDNAPTFQFLTYHMNLGNDLGGVGAKIFNFKTGPLSKSGINLSYAYHLKLNEELKLSFGLDASLYQFYMDRNSFNSDIDFDPVVNFGSQKLVVPDANFGAYLQADDYFVGLSIMQLLGRKVKMMNDDLFNNQGRHYFLHGGYNYDIDDKFTLQPSLLVKFVESGMGQFDLSLKGLYKDMVWLALGYRSDFVFDPNDLFIGLGVQKDKIRLGYTFDYTLSDIGLNSKGTHEIFLIYCFGDKKILLNEGI